MNIQKIFITVFCYVVLSFQSAFATIITASTTNISGNIWESRYTITNNSEATIYWFTIYFDFEQYQDIIFIRTPEVGLDWDVFAVEPFLTSDGFVDAFSFGDGITLGQSLSNFVVRYNYLGTDLPVVQSFEVYDPEFQEPVPIELGEVDITVVTEPNVLLLFVFGFIAMVAKRTFIRPVSI